MCLAERVRITWNRMHEMPTSCDRKLGGVETAGHERRAGGCADAGIEHPAPVHRALAHKHGAQE